jgi:uncharacterized membrane protein YbhN (UPF0104 family)
MSAVWARLRQLLVRDRDDTLRRRRPGDAARAVVGVVLLVPLAFHAGHYYEFERDIADALHDLPDGVLDVAKFAYELLSLWALGIVVVGVLVARRWRLGRDVAVAGVAAWVLGRLFAFFTRQTDLAHAFSVTLGSRDTPRFPLVRVGLAVAVIVVAAPYLARVTRWIGRVLVVLLALVALSVGRGFVTDLAAAIILGWSVACAVRFAFGTPIGRPTLRQVTRALTALAVPVSNLRLAPQQPIGRAMFLADRADGPGALRIVALGRDEADAQFLARAWRFLAYRDFPPNLFPTRRQQVEYEAYVCMLVGEGGASVPRTVVAANAAGVAVLVQAEAVGTRLSELPPEAVTDGLLDEAWRQAQLLHAVRVSHGALDADHLVIDGDVVTVVGWSRAVTGADARAAAHDLAQLLAATAAIVGVDRAVAAAGRNVEAGTLRGVLPLLQPAALSDATRTALDRVGDLDETLEQLRERAAAEAGTEVPELRRLSRIRGRQLLMAVSALLAIAFLFSRIGDPAEFWDSIKNASWGYVALAFFLGLATDVAFAVALLGTVPVRIPLWPVIELQSSLSFANLAVPVAADAAMQVRFLQKNGLTLSESVATGGVLSTVSEIIIQVSLFVIALWLAPDSIEFGKVDTTQVVVVVLGAIFLIGVAAAVVFSIRRIRRAVIPPVVQAARAMWHTVKSPTRLLLMFGGNIAAQCLYAASLLACLHAFGASLNFFTLLAVNIGIGLIASLVPLPGGGNAVSAIGISGIMVALGVPTAAAAAAVLAHQLAVSYLPAIPGWFASNDLARKGLL